MGGGGPRHEEGEGRVGGKDCGMGKEEEDGEEWEERERIAKDGESRETCG